MAYINGKKIISKVITITKIIDTFEALENNSLTELTSGIKNFKNSMFSGCTSLEYLELPNATSVGMNGCLDCSNLKTVKLASATSISRYAFQNCTSLTDIYLGYNGVVSVESGMTFLGVTNRVRIHVRGNLFGSYQGATNWTADISQGRVEIVGDYSD